MDDFAGFLEAKFELDGRSLNREVWQCLMSMLGEYERLKVLDIGTGTGAMLRRLINADVKASLSLTGLDRDPELLKIAERGVSKMLMDSTCRSDRPGRFVRSGPESREIEMVFLCRPLSAFDGGTAAYDLITAHAFMDLAPLAPTLDACRSWLKTGGLFYATIHYDGETVLYPRYHDAVFETELLNEYNASMERRTANGLPTGGAYCGRRLYQSLAESEFDILAYGSSDWNITPEKGAYRGADGKVIQRLLDWIVEEGARCSGIDPEGLKQWRCGRMKQLENAELGVIIRNLDILARRA